MARQLCGASPFVSHLRLFLKGQDEERGAVFYPGIGAISSLRNIIDAAGSTRSPPHSARLTEPVHLLYPNQTVNQQRDRFSFSGRKSTELLQDSLATGGRPPPLRPSRGNGRSSASRGAEGRSLKGSSLARDAGSASQDLLSVPLRPRKLSSRRPRTSPFPMPMGEDGEGQGSGAQSLWDSTQASDGHGFSDGGADELGSARLSEYSVSSTGYATADTSPEVSTAMVLQDSRV